MDYNPNDNWIQCDQNHMHWGAGGAAGLMLHHQDSNGIHRYLMQQRAPWVDQGGTWAPPSGALAPGEDPIRGSLREAQEELGPFQSANHEIGHVNDHGGWAFHTVTADTPTMFDPDLDDESSDAAWLTPEEIDELPLHPGFKQSWDDLRPQSQAPRLAAFEVEPQDNVPDPEAQVLDHLTMRSIAHNLHYKYKESPLTTPEAANYATRLLKMLGYRDPDQLTINTALNAWQQMYPGDKQLTQGPEAQQQLEHLESAPPQQDQAQPDVPSASWGYGTVSSQILQAPQKPLYHWTDASDLHGWMDDANNGPGETYLTEHGDAPDDESWNPEIPMMQNPVRLTIDHTQLDPDYWDPTYHGWLNNYLYKGPIPKSAISEIKAFPPAGSWEMPEHWGKLAWVPDAEDDPQGLLDDDLGATISPSQEDQQLRQIEAEPAQVAPSTQAAINHTGQIPGDENYMGVISRCQDNPLRGVNPSYTATVGHFDDGMDQRDVYIKPEGSFHSNDLAHERAAFGLAQEMGIHMPHTVVRMIPNPGRDNMYKPLEVPAVVQQAVPGALPLMRTHSPARAARDFPEDARRIALFDHVIGNHDRHMGNIVRDEEDRLVPIDHGGAFLSPQEYSPEYLGSYEGFGAAPLTDEEEEVLGRAYNHPLEQYGLPENEINGVRTRIQTMLSRGRHLGDGPMRNIPRPSSLPEVPNSIPIDTWYQDEMNKGYAHPQAARARQVADQHIQGDLEPSAYNQYAPKIHDYAAFLMGDGDGENWPNSYYAAVSKYHEENPKAIPSDMADILHEKLRSHQWSASERHFRDEDGNWLL